MTMLADEVTSSSASTRTSTRTRPSPRRPPADHLARSGRPNCDLLAPLRPAESEEPDIDYGGGVTIYLARGQYVGYNGYADDRGSSHYWY